MKACQIYSMQKERKEMPLLLNSRTTSFHMKYPTKGTLHTYPPGSHVSPMLTRLSHAHVLHNECFPPATCAAFSIEIWQKLFSPLV